MKHLNICYNKQTLEKKVYTFNGISYFVLIGSYEYIIQQLSLGFTTDDLSSFVYGLQEFNQRYILNLSISLFDL